MKTYTVLRDYPPKKWTRGQTIYLEPSEFDGIEAGVLQLVPAPAGGQGRTSDGTLSPAAGSPVGGDPAKAGASGPAGSESPAEARQSAGN